VFLAVVKGDGETILEFCGLKLIPDVWPQDTTPAVLGVTNSDVERRWAQESCRFAQLRALSPHFPRLVRLDPAADEAAGRLPPLIYSRPGSSFFVPPCPRCKRPLSLCRDEEWLAGAGLPSFGSTLDRVLYCRHCAREPGATVYTTSRITATGVTVRSAADLVDDLARALRDRWTQEEVVALVGDQAAKEVRAIPSGAEGARGGLDHFVPFTFYGSPFLLSVAAPFDLEGLADVIGGRPPEELAARCSGPAGSLPRRWTWLFRTPAPTRQFLFASDSTGLDAVENLYLKLTAFRQILEGVVQFYRIAGQPHLDLHPRHLLFELSGAGDGLPILWTLQARIHGIAASAVSLPAPGSPSVVLPGRGIPAPYAAPEVQEFRLAGHRPAEVVFTDLDEAGTGPRRFRLSGRLSDPYGLFPFPQSRDTILLSFPGSVFGSALESLAVRPATAEPGRAGETAFASDLLELTEESLRRLRVALGLKVPGARYRVFPDFGSPSDLYSLGVILLRLLLRNDGQDLPEVMKGVDRLAREIAALPPGEAVRSVSLASLVRSVPDAARLLAKPQIFWRDEDRRSGRPNAIPDSLWERAILLALRLVTRAPGFSVASGPADFDPFFREEKLERIVPEVVSILAEVQALLLDRQALHLEIQQILAELREDETLSEAAS
jgi:hypothetical protein